LRLSASVAVIRCRCDYLTRSRHPAEESLNRIPRRVDACVNQEEVEGQVAQFNLTSEAWIF